MSPKVNLKPDGIPPMPKNEKELLDGSGEESSSPSTSSEEDLDLVSEDLAGELYCLPFRVWHIFNPAVPPEPDPRVVAGVAAPFARILTKYGLGKIAKDELLVAFYLTQTVYSYWMCAKAEKQRQQDRIRAARMEAQKRGEVDPNAEAGAGAGAAA